MKRSAFLLLTFLLTTTSVTWAMEPLEEEGASRWNPPQIKQTEDSSLKAHLQFKPTEDPATAGDPYAPRWEQETTTSQLSITCKGSPFDPRPAPTPGHVIKTTSQVGGMIDLNLTGLTSLILSHNKIGDEGAKALANGNLPSLTSLRLFYNNIGDEGAKAIANGNLHR